MRQAHHIFLKQLAAILTTLAALAERTKDALLPGRTHGQHAVPATFGYKVAVWIDELCRHVERLHGCEGRVFVAMLGGGAGTLASLGEIGLATQDKMAVRLGMASMSVSPDYRRSSGRVCHSPRHAGSHRGKIGREIFTLMKQEFGEVEEPVPPGTVGSSTMPQKRNPKLSQDIVAAAAEIRALVPLALEAMQTEHEADRTTSIMMGRALAQACELTGICCGGSWCCCQAYRFFRSVCDATWTCLVGSSWPRRSCSNSANRLGGSAHDAVYDAAQASVTQERSFRELLAEDPHVSSRLAGAG